MIDPGPHRPKSSYFLEVQRRMKGVVFEQFKVFSGYRLDSFRQTTEENPETAGGAMHLQIPEFSLRLLVKGLTLKEIKPSGVRVGSDFRVPPFPILFR
jgi:hypothetical protein